MNYYLHPYISMTTLTHVMASGDAQARDLLKQLSQKELLILHNNRDLLERLVDIATTERDGLRKAATERFGLEVTTVGAGEGFEDFWISPDKERLFDALGAKAGWFRKVGHTGWYIADTDELDKWIRGLLLQEVRINLLIRYVEHKKRTKAETEDSESEDYGFYL